MRRANSSRPSPSVPSQCTAEMAARRSSMSMSVGLGSGNTGAKIATAKTNSIQPTAIQNNSPSLRFRRTGPATTSSMTVSSSVAMTNPGIEDGIEHVDDEIHQHVAGSHAQHDTLQDDEVAGIDRTQQQSADARQRKDRLDDDGAAHQAADIDAGDGDERQRRRFQRMHQQD